MNPPGDCLHPVYNKHKRAAINPFKTEHFLATTPAARKAIAQAHIFPSLFSYWGSLGIELNDDQIRLRSEVSIMLIFTAHIQ